MGKEHDGKRAEAETASRARTGIGTEQNLGQRRAEMVRWERVSVIPVSFRSPLGVGQGRMLQSGRGLSGLQWCLWPCRTRGGAFDLIVINAARPETGVGRGAGFCDDAAVV